MIAEFLQQLPPWMSRVMTVEFIQQLGFFLFALVASWLLTRLFSRRVGNLQNLAKEVDFFENYTGFLDAFDLILGALTPLFLLALLNVGTKVFVQVGREVDFLEWVYPLVGLLVVYRLATTYFNLRWEASRARIWNTQILRPIMLLVFFLIATNLWDDLLNLSISPAENIKFTFRSVLIGIFVLYVFWQVTRFVRTFLKETFLPNAGVDSAITQVISTLVSYAILLSGVLFGLRILGIDLTTFTVIAGGLSVGIGFGLQELINNFISGFILLFERSISPGDVVVVGDVEGVVQDIGLRSTQIRSRDNIDLIVPNGNFLGDVVTNYSKSDRVVRLHISVGVSYNSDPRQVEALLLQAAEHPNILKTPPPTALFAEFGDSSLNFDLRVWTTQLDSVPLTRSDIRFKIWDLFEQHDIEIPYPQQDVYIRSVPEK